jgi:uncharacterized protein (TIGR02145 family)
MDADYTVDPFIPDYTTNGAYYQWGRKDKAKDAPNSSGNDVTTITWNSATPTDHFGDDTDGENVTAKSGYDPCPNGYRIPSYNEWNGVINTSLNTRTHLPNNSWTNSKTSWFGYKFGEGLYLPAAGYRGGSNGTLYVRGSYGYYWSTRKYGTSYAYNMYFDSSGTDTGYTSRAGGLSVRCIVE